MIGYRYRTTRSKPLLAHVTTTDISLALLLGPQLAAFANSGFDVIGISAPGPFVELITSQGIEHIALRNATRSMSLRSDLRTLHELFRIFRAVRPDIVHMHNPKAGFYGRVAARAAGVPAVVNTVHGLYATENDRLTRRAVVYSLERLAASFSDAELIQNPEDLAQLRRLGVPTKRLHLLGNGIDLNRFSRREEFAAWRDSVRSELGATPDRVVITAVGRMVWEKGYAELFEAAKLVSGDYAEALFVIAGPSEPSKADGIGITEIEAAQRSGIQFLGYREDIERLYAASDIYVLPSHREGFPRSAMEAAAMGLPIVATNIRGCRQVVDDMVSGILVPPRSAEGLADALGRLVSHPEERMRMGRAGAVKAAAEFDHADIIRTTLSVYQGLLLHGQ